MNKNHRIMQDENAALGSSDSYDELTDLKPCVKLSRSIERQFGNRTLMAGSNSSYSSNETRTSRFNDRPVIGSPMFAARECLSTSEGSHANALWDELNVTSKTVSSLDSFDSNSLRSEKKSPIKKLYQPFPKSQIETAKEMFERRIRRIDSSFFRENPTQKVPRFVPTELWLGHRLGEGEFGSVFEIESLERHSLPPIDFDTILALEGNTRHTSDDSAITATGAPVGATMTMPLATDLIFGSGNLDNFLQRRLEGFEEQKLPPYIVNKENTDEQDNAQNDEHNRQSMDSSKIDADESIELHTAQRRPGLKATDRKGQMIDRQNNNEDFDSFNGYVVKVVRYDIQSERKKRVAAADMAAEAKLLSALSHRNIIAVRGIMGYIERPGNYGIIMDKLRSTLQDQIHEWAKLTSEHNIPTAAPEKHPLLENTPQWMLLKQEKDKKERLFRQTEFFVERMEAVLDVAQAMTYLHEKRIIFRDLKPENVGLTKDNYVLFDFGLSRELTDNDRVGDAEDQYHATGLTGSRLFMAPEVATKKPYGFSADVYSFGIMFWEVVSLQEVFPTMTMSKHYKLVIVKGRRPPSLEDTLPPELNDMMEAAWDKNPSSRPTFESICEILTQELEKNKNQSSTNNLSAGLRNFNFFNDENREGSRGFLDYNSKSFKTLSKLETAFEKIQETVVEKMLRITPKTSRPTTPK